MARKRKDDFEKWYSDRIPILESFAKDVATVIESAIQKHCIPYLSVTRRVKDLKRCIRKIKLKRYKDPKNDLTDCVGFRVISFTEDDALRISELLKPVFSIDETKSGNKADALSRDRVGYRSIHLVGKLDESRLKLIEFERYRGICFEVQVRTVLQHAWAEFEHSRNYKFQGVLPAALARDVNLIAGLLEVADKQINRLAKSIDEYKKETEIKTSRGELDIELTTTSLLSFLEHVKTRFQRMSLEFSKLDPFSRLIAECNAVGVRSVRDLDMKFTHDFVSDSDRMLRANSGFGVVRDALIYDDIDSYFRKTAGIRDWTSTDPESFRFFAKKYGASEVQHVFDEFGIATDAPPPDGESSFFEDEPDPDLEAW